ncbi:alpha/beta fold hydrolase [Marinobacterium rhizophilum]|uniref:Alpha/beta fold hydrolase n=1 Tax=Marinobacterium rhizophilum TaxID=420402 RepID=A0ABY5HLM4_9GAMM|nr:alpha/beta fold hydrolase [Marinobacterium rhizophilum]UTW13287.1 alpha/beta fold hydrolase [Marinobacterium rhizophilum]
MYKSWSFEVSGRRLAVMEWGDPDAVPVLALHGWLDNAATFMQLAPRLPAVRLIAIDLAGHGESGHRPAGTPYYIWDNIADVLAVADQLELERFSLLGHSMGAGVAMMLAACAPQRVARLFLIEGLAPLVYEARELPELMAEALARHKRMERRTLRPYETFEQGVAARINGRWPVSPEAARWLVERGLERCSGGWRWRSDPALMLPSVVRFSEAQVEAFLLRVRAPVELVLGTGGIDPARMQRLLPLLRDARLHVLAGNHHLHLEPGAAAEIATLIINSLREAGSH